MALHRLPLGKVVAIGFSVAAHAAAALTVALHQPVTAMVADEETFVNVSLVDARSFVAPVAPAAPQAPEPTPKPARSAEASPQKSAAPKAAVEAAPPRAVAAPQLIEVAQAPPTRPAPQVVVSTPGAALEDPMIEYRRRVWAHLAARAPSAPAGAGVAVVVFGTDEAGSILFARISRSSGLPEFDRACLRAIRAAAPLPRPPAGVSSDKLVFEAPIEPRRR